MDFKKSLIGLTMLFGAYCLAAQNQEKVDYGKYPDYQTGLYTGKVYQPPVATSADGRAKAPRALPRRVHNGEKSFFPPTFNQDAGSCGSASRIGYMFTSEINSYRNVSAAYPENVYPTHFTWLLTEHGPGKEGMARDNGIPNSIDYGGRTYSRLFGYQENHDPFGWMTGYGKWYRAMFNRISHTSQILTLKDPANVEMLKGWIYDHNGDPDFGGRGGVAGIGVASAATLKDIKEGPFKGQKYVQSWGESVDHALTIVGYDDDIWCDVNENNQKDEGETGVWIIANSWGGWANGGFVYCPYTNAKASKGSPDFWWPELYHVRKNYVPKTTFKIKMTYSRRSELHFSIGVSSNLNATRPDDVIALSHFTNCGWQIVNKVKLHDVPMLGKWADGTMHTEAMEFGYDLTDLVSGYDASQPLKYFLIIKSMTGATGEGEIEYCSVTDYSLSQEGLETSFDANNRVVLNKGRTTTLTTVVYPEPVNIPANIVWKTPNTELLWQPPMPSALTLTGYKIYKNNQEIAEVTPETTTYNVGSSDAPGAEYAVSAVYTLNGEKVTSQKSPSLKNIPAPAGTPVAETGSIDWRGTGFTITNVFANRMDECTLEFWIKPSSVRDWNFQIGDNWGTFLFHLNDNGGISAGYNLGDSRIDKVSNVPVNKWSHIAITMDSKNFIVYLNGKQIGKIKGWGMPRIDNFVVGKSGQAINGMMDEFRVWNKARTEAQINMMKDRLVAYPNQFPDLVAYYQMNKTEDGRLADAVNGNHAQINGTSNLPKPADYPLVEVANDFALAKPSCLVGEKINVGSSTQPSSTSKITWSAPDAYGIKTVTTQDDYPAFIFDKAGTYTITKSVEVMTGATPEPVSKTVEITELALPEPDFRINKPTVITGEQVSLTCNVQTPVSTQFEWTMEGAVQPKASTVNATALYLNPGEYTVTLKLKSGNVEKSVSKTIQVNMSAPSADFGSDKNFILKGGTVNFYDQSQLSPTMWNWALEGSDIFSSTLQNPVAKYGFAGKYKVSLTASNPVGASNIVKQKYIAVANEDPKTGLSFSGGTDYLTISPALDETKDTPRFTIEWWMSVNEHKNDMPVIGSDTQNLLVANEYGGGTINLPGGVQIVIPDGTFERNSWEHYALTVGFKTCRLYKNGVFVKEGTAAADITPNALGISSLLRFGAAENTLSASIDEVRVWNNILTPSALLAGLNQGIENPAAKANLDVYLKFDESANETPLNSSGKTRTVQRRNIGPAGDMWGASQAFTASVSTPTAFTPNSAATYKIIRGNDEKGLNITADLVWAEFKAEFLPDGEITNTCTGEKATDKNRFGIGDKKILTGTEEYQLTKSGASWNIKSVNTGLYVRADKGYMIPAADFSKHMQNPYYNFANNETGYTRVGSGGSYMQGESNQWQTGGDAQSFPFRLEEIVTVGATDNFVNYTGTASQQLRFTPESRLNDIPKTLNGKISIILTMNVNEWRLIEFPKSIENIRFIGRAEQGDTVRLGGRLAPGADYQIMKFSDGKFAKPTLVGGIIPKGAYLVRLVNESLSGKAIVFETTAGVTFENTPAPPVSNLLMGSGMARNSSPGTMNGYYTLNAERTMLTLVNGALETAQPFEAYIPFIGNTAEAPKTLDPNKAINDLTGVDDLYGEVAVRVWADRNGWVRISGSNSPYRVFNVAGVEIPAHKPLKQGAYVVLIEKIAYKIIVK